MSLDRLLITAGSYLLINVGGDKFDLGDGPTTTLAPGNFGIGHTFLAYTPTAPNTNPSYPASNLYDYKHPRRVWKSSVTGKQFIDLDFGALKGLTHLLVYNCNFIQAEIVGDDASDFSSPVYYRTRSWPVDDRVNRAKVLIELPGLSVRYLRLVIDTAYLTSGTVPEIGAIAAFDATGYKVMDINPDFGYAYQVEEAVKQIAMEAGPQERTQLSPHLKHVSRFTFGGYPRSKEGDLFTALTKAGKAAPLIYWENSPDGGHKGDKTYLCYLSSDVEVTWHLPQHVKSNDYKMEEVV